GKTETDAPGDRIWLYGRPGLLQRHRRWFGVPDLHRSAQRQHQHDPLERPEALKSDEPSLLERAGDLPSSLQHRRWTDGRFARKAVDGGDDGEKSVYDRT